MVRDAKRYAAEDGWGHARFDAKGEPVKVNPLKNRHECHLSAEKSGWVFTKRAE